MISNIMMILIAMLILMPGIMAITFLLINRHFKNKMLNHNFKYYYAH